MIVLDLICLVYLIIFCIFWFKFETGFIVSSARNYIISLFSFCFAFLALAFISGRVIQHLETVDFANPINFEPIINFLFYQLT